MKVRRAAGYFDRREKKKEEEEEEKSDENQTVTSSDEPLRRWIRAALDRAALFSGSREALELSSSSPKGPHPDEYKSRAHPSTRGSWLTEVSMMTSSEDAALDAVWFFPAISLHFSLSSSPFAFRPGLGVAFFRRIASENGAV